MDWVYGLSLHWVKNLKKNTLQGVKNFEDAQKYRKYDRFGPFEEEVTWLTKGRRKRLHHVTSSKEEKVTRKKWLIESPFGS